MPEPAQKNPPMKTASTERSQHFSISAFQHFRFTGLLSAFCFLLSFAAMAQNLTTDQPDYPPGATVTITGSGFGSNDTVTLQVLHVLDLFDNDTSPAHQPWTVTADVDGNFVTTWLIPRDEDEGGASLAVTATGDPSGLSATVSFTDADNGTSDITANFNATAIAVGSTI